METEDRRKFTRLPFHSTGTLATAAGDITFELQDISLKGALVQLTANEVLSEQQEYQFILELPSSGEVIEASVEVVHQQGRSIGLEFTLIDIDSITMLRRLIELNSGAPEKIGEEIRHLGDDE
ncbi:MAG: PilZ domain-containing protein [Spirochaeta sp.]